jgi:hypothetical protein
MDEWETLMNEVDFAALTPDRFADWIKRMALLGAAHWRETVALRQRIEDIERRVTLLVAMHSDPSLVEKHHV